MTTHISCFDSSHMQSTYSTYTNNAVFHDPIGVAEGIDSIRAQFNGLAKVLITGVCYLLRPLKAIFAC